MPLTDEQRDRLIDRLHHYGFAGSYQPRRRAALAWHRDYQRGRRLFPQSSALFEAMDIVGCEEETPEVTALWATLVFAAHPDRLLDTSLTGPPVSIGAAVRARARGNSSEINPQHMAIRRMEAVLTAPNNQEVIARMHDLLRHRFRPRPGIIGVADDLVDLLTGAPSPMGGHIPAVMFRWTCTLYNLDLGRAPA